MIGDQRKGMQLLESIKSESLQLENKPETKQIGNVMKDFLKSME
jgi:hypothetical protein